MVFITHFRFTTHFNCYTLFPVVRVVKKKMSLQLRWVCTGSISKNTVGLRWLYSWLKVHSIISRHSVIINISSVMEFQRWWVLKSKLFGQESTWHQGKIFKKILRVMTVCQKVPKSYFQSQFWMSKINRFFSKKNIHLRISI